ncbi:MAG TPA: SDR family oxidoreductase [Rhodothermales bacterium]|nr:SDR family oxidoreductase [Rhodothermales bacterium]
MAYNIDLSGKSVLVTGASRGIGMSVAEHLARAGARVAVHFRRNRGPAEELARSIGNDSFAIGADLASREACLSLFDECAGRMGRVDVLVANAGLAICAPFDIEESTWIDAWNTQMDVNLRASGILAFKAIKHFKEHGGGRIVFVSSRAAFRGDTADYMAYGASKSGLLGLNGSIARGFGKDNITSFVIAPGFTRTDMAQEFIDEYGEEYALSDIALNRLTEPGDIAPMVVLLSSGLADHATGTSIDVNAGSYVH